MLSTTWLLQVQQRKAAIADRLRQAGIVIKHSGVPGGDAQQEAAGTAGPSGGSTSGSAHDTADGDSASALDGTANGAQNGEVRIDVERGFRRWMREVSGQCCEV